MAAPASAAASAAAASHESKVQDFKFAVHLDEGVHDVYEQIRKLRCLLAKNLADRPAMVAYIRDATVDRLIEAQDKLAELRGEINRAKRKTLCIKREPEDQKEERDKDDEPLAKRLCTRSVLATRPARKVAPGTIPSRRPAVAAAAAAAASAPAAAVVSDSDSDDGLVDSDCDDLENMLSLGEQCASCETIVTADGEHGTDAGDRCGHCIDAALCRNDECRAKHWASDACHKARRKPMTLRRRLHIVDQDPDALLFKPECVQCLRTGPGVTLKVCHICNWARVCGLLDCMTDHNESCKRQHPQRAAAVEAHNNRVRSQRYAAAAAAAAAATPATPAITTAMTQSRA